MKQAVTPGAARQYVPSPADGCLQRIYVRPQTGLQFTHLWYGMVNVDLYSAIITKVSNALDTLVSGEKPGFQTLVAGGG